MRWSDVTLAVVTAVQADATLVSLFGDNIRAKGQHEHRLPSLEYMLISTTLSEVMEPTVIQFDVFAETMVDLINAEQALLDLFDHELGVSIAGLSMLCSYIDGAPLDVPSSENTYARAARFAFEPVRSALQRP